MRILIVGASYGALIAARLVEKGLDCTLVCNSEELEIINSNGLVVKFKEREFLLSGEDEKKIIRGNVKSTIPNNCDFSNLYDCCFLAIAEGQLLNSEIQKFLKKIGEKKIPTVSVMNIPPIKLITQELNIPYDLIARAYNAPMLWDFFDASLIAHASADPQIFKSITNSKSVINVRLASDFKISNFRSVEASKIIKNICNLFVNDRNGVAFREYDSIFVSLSKWSMLVTGNYRCLDNEGQLISIKDAVHADLNLSQDIYNSINSLLKLMGASRADLVPFHLYAKAALMLDAPSSFSRAVHSGVKSVERTDKLINIISKYLGVDNPLLNNVVERNDRIIG